MGHNKRKCPRANIRNGNVELPRNQISSTTTTSDTVLTIPKNHSKDTNINEDSDDNSEVPGLIDDADSDDEEFDPILAEQRANERTECEETKHRGANEPFADDNWQEVHVQQRIYGTAYDPDVISPPRYNIYVMMLMRLIHIHKYIYIYMSSLFY